MSRVVVRPRAGNFVAIEVLHEPRRLEVSITEVAPRVGLGYIEAPVKFSAEWPETVRPAEPVHPLGYLPDKPAWVRQDLVTNRQWFEPIEDEE